MSIFFTKVAGLQSKKDSAGDIFVKCIWVVTASAKYYSFSLFPRPYLQNVPPDFSFPEQTMWVACEQLFLEVQDN